MTNSNKCRGDWGELVAQRTLQGIGFPWTEKTRAGYERDLGDLHLVPARLLIAQVKNVQTPRWSEWLDQLDQQVINAGAQHGFLLWKPRGIGESRASDWLAVMRLRNFAPLARQAGYGEPYPEVDVA